MKDISIYFKPVSFQIPFEEEVLGNYIQFHKDGNFPTIKKKGVAILNIPEYRNHKQYTKDDFHFGFREQFYQLYQGFNWEHAIYDLGTILPGEKIEDTFYAISTVCRELIKKDVLPIIIGGTQDLTKAIYHAYEELEQMVNITTIDNQLDLGNIEEPITHNKWLSHILLHKPCYLFNYTNIGAQAHYIPNKTIHLFDELYFDVCRLGEINGAVELAEPLMRNTDLLSMDLTSIRASDLQNEYYTSPNGLLANEACRIVRYAGISDKVSSFGLLNYYSKSNQITDELVAQLIWYFNEGYAHRKGDFPIGSKKNYIKYTVFLEDLKEEIVFYKSDKSGRWWIEVPYPGRTNSKYLRHQMVPCSYEIYEEAMRGEIPNLWWKTYQKLV